MKNPALSFFHLCPGKMWLLALFLLPALTSNLHAQKEWYYRGTTLSTEIHSVSVVDSLYIYVIDRYALRKTTDGGASWKKLRDHGLYPPIVRFWNRNDGTLVIHGNTLATSDGGVTWRVVNNYYLSQGFYFYDSLNGITFKTNSGYTYPLYFGRTSNAGYTWTW